MWRRLILPLLCLGLLAAPAAAERPFVVVMAAESADRAPDRDSLALIFKRKQIYWAGGGRVQAVNLPASHPLRRTFSQTVLGQLPEDMEAYWQDMYFHGVQPPFVLASEEAVLRFVAANPGAIGYVSACNADRRVVVVMSFGEARACPK